MGKNKVLLCEEKYGFYIHAIIGMNSEFISKFKAELLEYAKTPEDMKKLAQAIKNVIHNGTYPKEKLAITKEFCADDTVKAAIISFANESEAVSWLQRNFLPDTLAANPSLSQELAAANDQIAALQTRLDSFQQAHDAQITRYEKQIADAQNELEKARLQAEKTAAEAEEQIDHLLDELNETKQSTGADSTARIEALESDLTLSKRKIKKLEAEISDMKATASEYTVSNIIAGIGPSLNDLLQYPVIARSGRLDEDAVTGMESALQSILDSLAEEGVKTIGPVGSKTDYDPAMHHCDRHIAGGTPVVIKAPGYTVNNQVIIPAYVEVKEEN